MISQILLIDDDPIINLIHSKLIGKSFPGIPLLIFENGYKGLEYIKSNPHNSYLIFLDLNMPKMDGWEFLKAISLEKNEVDFQIHVVTSSVNPEDRERVGKDKNVRSLLVKPLKYEELTNIIFHK